MMAAAAVVVAAVAKHQGQVAYLVIRMGLGHWLCVEHHFVILFRFEVPVIYSLNYRKLRQTSRFRMVPFYTDMDESYWRSVLMRQPDRK